MIKTAALEILNYLNYFSLSLPICLQTGQSHSNLSYRFWIVLSRIGIKHKNYTLSTKLRTISPFSGR